MTEKEVIKYLKNIKDRDLWIRGYVYGKEALETVLQLLEQKDNKINKVIDKLKEDKEKMQTIYDDKEMDYYNQIDELLKILEE